MIGLRARLHRAATVLGQYALVALGAGLGGGARVALSLWAATALPPGLPWGTLIANGGGSLLIGFYAALTGPGGRLSAGVGQRLFVMAGFCGGFTTFSMFSLEMLRLLQGGALAHAAGLAVLSLSVWIGSAALGYAAGTALGRRLPAGG